MELYSHHLEIIKQLYPEIYIKLIELPKDTIKGIINDMHSGKIDLQSKEKVNQFFKFRFKISAYIFD